MFKANYTTKITLGGKDCPHSSTFEFDEPAMPIVASLPLSEVPAEVIETLVPKVSVGLEPQIQNRWNVYTTQEISWASKVVCAQACGSQCKFAAELAALSSNLEEMKQEQA